MENDNMEKKENLFLIIVKDIVLFLFIIGCTIGGVLIGHKLKEQKNTNVDITIVENEVNTSQEREYITHMCSSDICFNKVDNSIYFYYYNDGIKEETKDLSSNIIVASFYLSNPSSGYVLLENGEFYELYYDNSIVFNKLYDNVKEVESYNFDALNNCGVVSLLLNDNSTVNVNLKR